MAQDRATKRSRQSPGYAALPSSLDATASALFVCDIQAGKLGSLVQGPAQMRASSKLLVQVASTLSIPVVVTEQVPKKLGYTHAEIKAVLPATATVIEKKLFSMVTPAVAALLSKLRESSPDFAVILCGIEAHVCILQTCLDLLRLGVGVFVVTDAVSSQRRSDYDVAMRRMERSGAQLTTAESVVFELLKTSGHEHFRACSRFCVARAKSAQPQKKKETPQKAAETGAVTAAASGVQTLRLNTSNKNKYREFCRMFASITGGTAKLDLTKVDVPEIDAAPFMVVAQKAASAGAGVIVEDTSLEVTGADVGVNVRWVMDNLSTLTGRTATWRVLLGILRSDGVHIYEGVTTGTIVAKRGNSDFGFDPVFQPDGSTRTLAEEKPDAVNARFKAVKGLLSAKPAAIHVPIAAATWKGKWQHD